MIGLIGKKLGHTRVYNARGEMTAVTVILAGPNRVVQVKKQDGKDGYNAVQLGFGAQKESRLSKAVLGHLKKFSTPALPKLKEFRDFSKEVKTGDVLGPDLFQVGDFVDVIGVTKGRGFEGVVKRHHFRGGDITHGSKGWHRRPGAIGQRLFPGTVRRGMRMAGHMGQVQRTTQNLEVVQVRPDDNLILIKGACPGSEGDYVIIREAKKLSRTIVAARAAKQKALASSAPGKAKAGNKTADKAAAAKK